MQVAIVGAGVIGLACAAELSRRGHRVYVLDRGERPGEETSSRNSQVIHAGLYYPEGSLKARTCARGRALLYERCRTLGIGYRRTGKLVVATELDEVTKLEQLLDRGKANGGGALEIVDRAAHLQDLEPRVRAVAALWSPDTGIVDAHELLKSYEAEAVRHGAEVVMHTRVRDLCLRPHGWRLDTETRDGEAFELDVEGVINAAGLGACDLAAKAGLDLRGLDCTLHPCKGDYFTVAPGLGAITRHLVYPLPDAAGLGIHTTFDLAGRYTLGPDTTYVDAIDYRVEPGKANAFARAVQRYLPEIKPEHLSPNYAGIRPKLQGPGSTFRDFVIEDASDYGAPGLINLLGIESPGLTAAGAIAECVAEIVSGGKSP